MNKFSWTRCSSDEECRRKRYLSREWGGTGLMPIRAGWALVHGNIIHKALEDFVKLGSIDFTAVRKQVQSEAALSGFDGIGQRDWIALVEGQLKGFIRAVWPYLISEYDVVDTERWITFEPKPGFQFRARQDLLLKNKFNSTLAYVDYKNTSSQKPQWIKSWAKSVQLHSSAYALRAAEGIEVDQLIVIGLYKGYKDEKTGGQKSIFNTGYVNREFGMTPEYSYEYKRARGWEKFSTLEEFDTLDQWIDRMPTELLTEQFPQTPPISPRYDIAETWFRQQMIREVEVAEAIQLLHSSTSVEEIDAVLDKYFKQNFSHCDPAYGYACEYQPLCWIPHVAADPIGSGQFKLYESEIEVE